MSKIKKREALLGVVRTRAESTSPSATEDDRTLTFTIISDNNEGTRYDWFSGESYIERLDVSGAKTERLNTFFKDHNRGVDDAIGKVESVRMDGGSLKADVVFGSGSDSILNKYREGILTDVSIGYSIEAYDIEERKDDIDIVTVTDYTIRELSAVGIGFDTGAKHDRDMEIVSDQNSNKENKMEKPDKDQEIETKKVIEPEKERDGNIDEMAQKLAEMERKEAIRSAADRFGADSDMIRTYVNDDTKSVQDFKDALLEKRIKETPDVKVKVGDVSNKDEMVRAMEDALVVRFGGDVAEPHKDINMFRQASMIDFAKSLTGISGYDKNKIAERAMVTADFPNLLLNSGNRVLTAEFDEAAGTYREFVKEVDVSDFRTNTDITFGNGGRLDKLLERGELKNKYPAENAETWNIESYGNQFDLTRKMIINDDLGAFSNMLSEFGSMAGVTANGIVYDLLLSRNDFVGFTMADGIAIFHADHGNTASGSLSSGTLSAARLAMAQQKALDGETALNITPEYLIVGPGNAQTAFEIINSTASMTDNKNEGVVNYHNGALKIIVDAELDSDQWYVTAGRRTIKAGYLSGTGRRPVLKVNDSTLTKTIFEGIFDFGAMPEDYRGLYKGK